MRRDFAATRIHAKNPEAVALFNARGGASGLVLRAAANGEPAEILLYDEIGFWGITAKDFISVLADAGDGPVRLRINSPGGDVFDGLSMMNAIRQRGGVSVVIDGIAASIASVIAMGATEVAMHEASMMMIHKAWSFTIGNEDDHLDTAVTLSKIDGQLAGIYAGKTGAEADAMLDLMKAETWLTSTEAKEQGFADSVLTVAQKQEKPKSLLSAGSIAALHRRLRLAEAI